MRHSPIDTSSAVPIDRRAPGVASCRRHCGRTAYFAGRAAEDAVSRDYRRRGGAIRAVRHRTPEGELDLIVAMGDVLVFVEVKRRKHIDAPDSPIHPRQWRRLECAALHYMMQLQNETGVQPVCRFDVALVGRFGQMRIIENARSFDD